MTVVDAGEYLKWVEEELEKVKIFKIEQQKRNNKVGKLKQSLGDGSFTKGTNQIKPNKK